VPLYRVTLPDTVFGVVTDDQQVITKAAPIAGWSTGRQLDVLQAWTRGRGGTIQAMSDSERLAAAWRAYNGAYTALLVDPTAGEQTHDGWICYVHEGRRIPTDAAEFPLWSCEHRHSRPREAARCAQRQLTAVTEGTCVSGALQRPRTYPSEEVATGTDMGRSSSTQARQEIPMPNENENPTQHTPGGPEPNAGGSRGRSRGPALNQVMLIGRLTADPDMRALPDGRFVTNLRMATNEREQPEYHQLTAFGKPAEFSAEYLKTGRLVYIEGRLSTQSYFDRETGEKKYSTKVLVNQIQPLDRPRQDQRMTDQVQQEALRREQTPEQISPAATASAPAPESGPELTPGEVPF
jgi:single-strand DNA-binding protein